MLNTLGVLRRLRWFLPALLLAVAVIAYTIAVPTNWFRSAEVTGTIVSVPPNTWIVDDDGPAHFRKIQEAINAANLGDTILVRNGTYYENVVVNKTLALVGEEKNVTVIDGNGITPGTVVTVTANNVIVSNFTVQNSGGSPEDAGIRLDGPEGSIIINNIMRNNVRSIDLVGSVSNDISGNTISDAGYSGVALRYSHNNTIIDNLIVSNVLQIHSFQLWESNSNTLSSNVVYGSGTDYGISLQTNSNHNNIDANLFLSNDVGINVGSNSNHNKIRGNNITSGNRYGILAGAGGNVINHNNFIDNARQVWTNSINIWDDGYPSGGNYWSDYADIDEKSGSGQDLLGSDGVGDTPYIIDANNQDRYPLMKPWSPRVTSVITISTELEAVTVGSNITLSGTITPVRANVNVTVYQRLVGEGMWNTLVTLKTNSTGGYTYVWKPTQIATYELKAIWLGDESTLPAESGITIVNVEPIHDIAIVSVAPSATEVYVGWAVNISVVVRNEGNVTETFTVTCKYELESIEHTIGTATVNSLAQNTNTTLTFTWATTDITVHTISVEIPVLTDETDTSDNTMTSPIAVKVKMLGDVNGDNKIDIQDIAQAALSFGTYRDHLRYNMQADINQDNKVDIRDLALIAKNFGKTHP